MDDRRTVKCSDSHRARRAEETPVTVKVATETP